MPHIPEVGSWMLTSFGVMLNVGLDISGGQIEGTEMMGVDEGWEGKLLQGACIMISVQPF